MWLVHVVALVVGDTGIGWVGACELVVFGFAWAWATRERRIAFRARGGGAPIAGAG
jgi:hypothetical protein